MDAAGGLAPAAFRNVYRARRTDDAITALWDATSVIDVTDVDPKRSKSALDRFARQWQLFSGSDPGRLRWCECE